MTKAGLFQWYNDLPGWGRAVMIIGVSGVAVYTGYSIIKTINDKKKLAAGQQEVTGFVSDLNALASQGQVPVAQQSQYQQWADSIATQFAGCDPSLTLNSPIYGSFQFSDSGQVVANIISNFKTDADFLALQAAFGVRTISKHWWCGGDDTNVTLSAAVNDQLDTAEVAQLNSTLAGLGLTYKF